MRTPRKSKASNKISVLWMTITYCMEDERLAHVETQISFFVIQFFNLTISSWASCVSAASVVSHLSVVTWNQRPYELVRDELCIWSGRANLFLCWVGRYIWNPDALWNAANAYDLYASTIKQFYCCHEREMDESIYFQSWISIHVGCLKSCRENRFPSSDTYLY